MVDESEVVVRHSSTLNHAGFSAQMSGFVPALPSNALQSGFIGDRALRHSSQQFADMQHPGQHLQIDPLFTKLFIIRSIVSIESL